MLSILPLPHWDGYGWYHVRPRSWKDREGNWRRSEGFEVTLEDLAKKAGIPRPRAERLAEHLVRAGLADGWCPGADECVRLIPPTDRWRTWSRTPTPSLAPLSGDTTPMTHHDDEP